MFLRCSSLEDNVICPHSLVPLAVSLATFFFLFFVKHTLTETHIHTYTHVVQYNDTFRPSLQDGAGQKESKGERKSMKAELPVGEEETAGGGRRQPASGCATMKKAPAGFLGSASYGGMNKGRGGVLRDRRAERRRQRGKGGSSEMMQAVKGSRV